MKKISLCIISLLLCVVCLTGCQTTSSKTITFKVDTGDRIDIKINTSDGLDLTSDVPFSVKKDDKTLSEGTFATHEQYLQYIYAIENNEEAKVIDSVKNDTITYTFYNYNDSEYNYIIYVNDSDTAVILGNAHSQKEAKEVFNNLTITKH